jgi:hypothetical protein
MNSDGRSTSQQLYIPTLLVVGGWEDLVDRCLEAADASGLSLKTCSIHEAPAAIPRRHPLAIVVPHDVYDPLSHDLEALARDVRSTLIQVDPEVSVRELEAMFAAAITGCSSQRERRGGAGRYSITETLAEEAPFSRSTPPPSSRAPMSARQTLPRVPGLVSTRPTPVPAEAERPSYAAIRAVFSGR